MSYDGHEFQEPLTVDLDESPNAKARMAEENPALSTISEEDEAALLKHLRSRLVSGAERREPRIYRFMRIDRAISTWQRLNAEDSRREQLEDNTGKAFALPVNIPLLASHLTDMTSYFAEALAPISNPFASASGEPKIAELTKRLNKDALSRDYYGELVLAMRGLLKYNFGGMHVTWDEGSGVGVGAHGVLPDGNSWRSLDPYNTIWDTTVTKPSQVAYRAEWAAEVRLTNRIEMARRSLSGEWTGLQDLLKKDSAVENNAKNPDASCLYLYRNPEHALPTEHGEDSQTTSTGANVIDSEEVWASFGLGVDPYQGSRNRPHELVTCYCWIRPAQFGLIFEGSEPEFTQANADSDSFLELWKFELIDSEQIVSARPVIERSEALKGIQPLIPMFLTYMTNDQLGQAQRSMMELMKGFQRFSSAMYNIYIAGMRGNVWGLKGVDPQMYDVAALKSGDTAGVMESKQPGRDVRTGFMRLDSSTGVETALGAVESTMQLKDNLFPSQALPGQVAGLDRAVTSQVTTVVQGAQRSLRMLLRLLDSSLMMPTRMQAVRNLQDNESEGPFDDITDEDVAKSLGSGIESMEAERVTEALWRLLMAIVQNQEAMQTFNVPEIMAYLGRTLNISTDMSSFVRQQQQPQGGAEGQADPNQPPPQA